MTDLQKEVERRVRETLDALANEHGSETFVSDGYGYYYDALEAFTKLVMSAKTPAAATKELLSKSNSEALLPMDNSAQKESPLLNRRCRICEAGGPWHWDCDWEYLGGPPKP